MATNKETIVNTWRGLGWTDNQIAAGLGNLQQESNFNPNAFNSKESAFGIAQWRGDRLTNLQNYAAQNGLDYTDVGTQAQFINYEMTSGSEQSAGNKFFNNQNQDPGNLAATWDQSYERSAGTERDQRIANANAFSQPGNLDDPNFRPGKTGPANPNMPNNVGSPAAGGGGGGGGGGCAGGLLGAVGMIAMGGLLSGVGISSVMNNVTGGLTGQISSSLSGALGGGFGSLSGALGGITQGIQGALSQVQNAIGGVMSQVQSSISGVMSSVTGALQQIPGIGDLIGAANSLGSVTGPIQNAISSIGANILPGLGNVLPPQFSTLLNAASNPFGAILQNPQGVIGAAQLFTSKGGLTGMITQVAGNMAGNFIAQVAGAPPGTLASGSIQNFMNNISQAAGIASISQTVTAGVGDAVRQAFGDKGLGSTIQNMEGLATFGLSTLGNNLKAVGGDMINMGSLDASNMTRLMQPSNVCAQIIVQGHGQTTGLLPKLINRNVPLATLDNPLNDSICQEILNTLTDPDMIDLVKTTFGINVPLKSLGQMTDLKVMMPNTASTLPVSNFKDLGLTLQAAQVTQAPTFKDIGSSFVKMESTRDLNNLSQLAVPMDSSHADILNNAFGYGSGTQGGITMADVMGTAAGYTHEHTLPVILENTAYLASRPDVTLQYFFGTRMLNKLGAGYYTSSTSSGGSDSGGDTTITYTYTVPYNEPGYTNGFIGTFTDSAQISYPDGNGQPGYIGPASTSGLESAVLALKTYIEAGMTTIANSTDPDIQKAVHAIETAHAASCAQLVRENTLLTAHNVDLFQPQQMTPFGAYGFAMQLQTYGLQTGYGQPAEYIERICQNNVTGDSIKFTMRQARNAQILQDLGVNTERFNLPVSQYYRDPLAFTRSVYDGQIPTIAAYQMNMYYPPDKLDAYILERDALLAKNGYLSDTLSPANKDELYGDTYWQNKPDWINSLIGEAAVAGAMDRNLTLRGNDLLITDVDGTQKPVGKLGATGISDYDPNALIDALMNIVNKLLYGDIGATKNTNPFNTDQIIYGLAELLGNISPLNLDSLRNTYLASQLGAAFDRIANRLQQLNPSLQTPNDRNDPTSYGGSGPGIDSIRPGHVGPSLN
jgi:hypothetical protein